MTDTAQPSDQPDQLPRDKASVLRNEQGDLVVHVPPEMVVARQQEQIVTLSGQNISLSFAVEAYRDELASAIKRIEEQQAQMDQMGQAIQAMVTDRDAPPGQPCTDCPEPSPGATIDAVSRTAGPGSPGGPMSELSELGSAYPGQAPVAQSGTTPVAPNLIEATHEHLPGQPPHEH